MGNWLEVLGSGGTATSARVVGPVNMAGPFWGAEKPQSFSLFGGPGSLSDVRSRKDFDHGLKKKGLAAISVVPEGNFCSPWAGIEVVHTAPEQNRVLLQPQDSNSFMKIAVSDRANIHSRAIPIGSMYGIC